MGPPTFTRDSIQVRNEQSSLFWEIGNEIHSSVQGSQNLGLTQMSLFLVYMMLVQKKLRLILIIYYLLYYRWRLTKDWLLLQAFLI